MILYMPEEKIEKIDYNFRTLAKKDANKKLLEVEKDFQA